MTTLSLTQVEIDGFRGLRSLNLNDLGRINILVGSNNCGKTSVLEALTILCEPQNPREWVRMSRRRDFGRLDETIVQSLRWCFTQTIPTDYNLFVEASCQFKCNGDFPLRELNVKYREFEESIFDKDSTNDRVIRKAEIVHSAKLLNRDLILEEMPDITFKISQLAPHFLRRKADFLACKMLTPYSYQTNRTQVISQSEQLFSEESVSQLLGKFDPDIVAVRIGSFGGDRPAIYVKHRKLGEAPLSIFGDATRRTVLLTTTLLSLKAGGILLIDEIEAGIHISALTNVFNWLVEVARKLEVQLFVTTHSLEALDALISAHTAQTEDDIVVYQLSQTEEKTRVKRFSGDLLRSLRFESGLDVR